MTSCRIVDFAVPADHKVKLKGSEKYLDLAGELKKTVEQKSDDYISCNCSWCCHQRIDTRA